MRSGGLVASDSVVIDPGGRSYITSVRPNPDTTFTMSRVDQRAAAACAVAALLGGLVYVNALRNPFVYDDHHTVVENGSLARLSDFRAIVAGAVTRPLVNFSYALDRAVWGSA